MINNHSIFNINFKLVISGLLTLFVVACGGGGDGDDGGDATDYSLLSEYVYSINRTVDQNLQQTDGLTISANINSTTATLRIDPHPVTGTFHCDPDTDECGLATIATGSFLDVIDDPENPIVGDLHIGVLEEVIIGTSGRPILGTVQIQTIDGSLSLEVRFGSNACASDEIEIYDQDQAKSLGCYTWDEFENLFDTSPDQALQLASFGFQVLGFLFEQVDLVTQGLGLIDENETALEEAGPISEMCDAFSAAGLTAPDGIPDPGTVQLSWTDNDANNEVGPGDDFLLIFDNCWINDPTDDVDDLLNGQLEFLGYTDVVDDTREVITRIGFEPGVSTPGGVFFLGNFTASETEGTAPGPATITDVFSITGGVSVVFSEP